jgi:hypothetical protein
MPSFARLPEFVVGVERKMTASLESITVALVQLHVRAHNPIRFHLWLPFQPGTTVFADLADGIAYRLNQFVMAPANFIEVNGMHAVAEDTLAAVGEPLMDSLMPVQPLPAGQMLAVTYAAYAISPEEAEIRAASHQDHLSMTTASVLSGGDREHFHFIFRGTKRRTVAPPLQTIGDLLADMGLTPLVQRIVDTTTGASICPIERCGHVFSLVAEVELEGHPDAVKLQIPLEPVSATVLGQQDEYTAPIVVGIATDDSDDD